MILITCNKPVCPVPVIRILNIPEVKVSLCSNTTVPVQLTSCVQRVMTGVNRILYARHFPSEGITHKICPDPVRWKPYEVNNVNLNYQLFFPVDECGSGTRSPHLSYLFMADDDRYDFTFSLFNAKEDDAFTYYGYCLPEVRYRGEIEYDVAQNFSFYYLGENNEIIYISKKDIVSVKSITLDCDYINNYSAPYINASFFNNSSFGIAVELEMERTDGSGTYLKNAYIKSVTGLGGDFGAWIISVFWKEVI